MKNDFTLSDTTAPNNDEFTFTVPHVRWANVQTFHNNVTDYRQIYDHELIYVLEGKGQIFIDRTPYEARPNRLFLIQPRVWNSYQPARDVVMRLLGVHFDWPPQEDDLQFASAPPGRVVDESRFRRPSQIVGWDLASQPFLDLSDHLQVRQSLEMVVEEYRPRNPEAQEIAGAFLVAAMLQIQRAMRLMEHARQSTLLGADALRRAASARALLEESPQSPHSIEHVAVQVGWSSNHLRRVFRQAFGLSPLQFQTNARLHYSRELLRYQDTPIAEIGARCGFADAAHFTRIFKAHSGLTPRQYRRQIKRL